MKQATRTIQSNKSLSVAEIVNHEIETVQRAWRLTPPEAGIREPRWFKAAASAAVKAGKLAKRRIATELAALLDCDAWVSLRSWHYPGKTIRITLAKSQIQPAPTVNRTCHWAAVAPTTRLPLCHSPPNNHVHRSRIITSIWVANAEVQHDATEASQWLYGAS